MISALGQKLTPRNPDCSNTQFVALKIPKVIKPTATELEDRNFALHESTTRSGADENMNKQRLTFSRSLTLNVSENSNSVFWKYVILCLFWIWRGLRSGYSREAVSAASDLGHLGNRSKLASVCIFEHGYLTWSPYSCFSASFYILRVFMRFLVFSLWFLCISPNHVFSASVYIVLYSMLIVLHFDSTWLSWGSRSVSRRAFTVERAIDWAQCKKYK